MFNMVRLEWEDRRLIYSALGDQIKALEDIAWTTESAYHAKYCADEAKHMRITLDKLFDNQGIYLLVVEEDTNDEV